MARRAKVTSTEAAVQIAAKSAKKITVPAHVPLTAEDMPFWNSVIAEFARSEWTDHQLELAAMLSRTMADLNREQQALRVEGAIAYSDKGTPVVNPRKAIIQMHAGTILSFRRSLALHARAQTDTQKIGVRRAHEKSIEADMDSADGDLIPRIHAVK